MDASLIARLRELEDENRHLKNMYAEERLKAAPRGNGADLCRLVSFHQRQQR